MSSDKKRFRFQEVKRSNGKNLVLFDKKMAELCGTINDFVVNG